MKYRTLGNDLTVSAVGVLRVNEIALIAFTGVGV